jgi:hypothetical protein
MRLSSSSVIQSNIKQFADTLEYVILTRVISDLFNVEFKLSVDAEGVHLVYLIFSSG